MAKVYKVIEENIYKRLVEQASRNISISDFGQTTTIKSKSKSTTENTFLNEAGNEIHDIVVHVLKNLPNKSDFQLRTKLAIALQVLSFNNFLQFLPHYAIYNPMSNVAQTISREALLTSLQTLVIHDPSTTTTPTTTTTTKNNNKNNNKNTTSQVSIILKELFNLSGINPFIFFGLNSGNSKSLLHSTTDNTSLAVSTSPSASSSSSSLSSQLMTGGGGGGRGGDFSKETIDSVDYPQVDSWIAFENVNPHLTATV